MAHKEQMVTISGEAGGDLSSDQYRFVQCAADGQWDVLGSAGAHADGILQNDPDAAGKAASIAISGVVKVQCGGTVTAGGPVAVDGSGDAVDATSGDVILGTALETGADGEVISMLFHPRAAL